MKKPDQQLFDVTDKDFYFFLLIIEKCFNTYIFLIMIFIFLIITTFKFSSSEKYHSHLLSGIKILV